MAGTILVVDDEPAIREMIGYTLSQAGFSCAEASDVQEAETEVHRELPDLIVLDWMLPGGSGIDFARWVRRDGAAGTIPIIMVTARGEAEDKVRALSLGADDYLTKPFAPRELVARVEAVLRRTRPDAVDNLVKIGGLILDPKSHRVYVTDQALDLGPTEFRMLHVFMAHPDRAYSRAQLLDLVWGRNLHVGDRTVDMHVSNLRKALEPHGYGKMIPDRPGSWVPFLGARLTMLRAWRGEFLFVVGIGLGLFLLGLLVGAGEILLGAGVVGYLCWHLYNLFLLQRWIGSGGVSRLPVSLGGWEGIFDGLQRHQLGGRRRRRGLAQTLSEFRGAAARIPDALVVLDDQNRILWFNRAAERLLALKWPRDQGQNVTRLVRHPALSDALAGGGSARPLEVTSPANGAWMLNLQVTASFGRARRRMLVARDITPLHRVEGIRRDFVANVSHELRTPITVFRGYIEALRESGPGPDWVRPVALMAEQSERMQALVDDLLLLSRLELAGRSEPTEIVSVAEMLDSIVEQARALSGLDGHDLILDADPAVRALARKEDLHSAFSNIIFNAVRHTPPGTRVEVHWEGEADHASLTVRDFGAGIAAKHLPRLTERFYRVESSRSRQGGGTGLGLAITKHVLERCGAELKIDSTIGRGSTFVCQFPGASVDIGSITSDVEMHVYGV